MNYRIVVGDLEGQIMYYEADLKQPVALVIGNEIVVHLNY